jgi:hypothetical protein
MTAAVHRVHCLCMLGDTAIGEHCFDLHQDYLEEVLDDAVFLAS